MDICVVTYRNTAERVAAAVRSSDQLWVRDNTHDNIGFPAAANELASKGTAAVICFVNPDGDPQPHCFDLLESAFDDPAVVGAEPSQGPSSGDARDRDRTKWLAGACMAVRRSAFERVGGFDPRFFLYAEDVDLSLRLSKVGTLVHRWDAQFIHDGGSRSFRAQRLQARNGLVVHARHGVGPGPGAVARGALSALRYGRPTLAIARVSGLVSFYVQRSRLVSERTG